MVWLETIEIFKQRTAFIWCFAQEVDWCLKDCGKQRLQTTVSINLWKIFAGHTGDWFDVRTASICTTDLWDPLKSFILNSLKFKVAPYPIIVSLDTLKVWRSPLHAVFYWNVKGKTRKKRKNTAGFVMSLGAGVQLRSTVQLSCLSAVSKNGRFRSFFSALGVIWQGKAFRDQQCQFLTRKKSLSSENESNCSMTSECVRTDSILPRGAGLEHGRSKQSIF